MNDSELMKWTFNQILNSKFTPPTQNIFVYHNYAFFGYKKDLETNLRAAGWDWDYVWQKNETKPLYRLTYENVSKLQNSLDKVDEIVKFVQSTGNIQAASQKFLELYRDKDVREKDLDEAIEEAVRLFEFKPDAEKFGKWQKDEMGIVAAIFSGSPKKALDKLAPRIYIDPLNVYGTAHRFDINGNVVSVELLLNEMKVPAMEWFLRKNVDTEHGCVYIISDDPVADAPMAKYGLNPSFFIGNYKRENLNFDVTVPVPEAMEKMCALIPKMYAADYGWLIFHTRKPSVQKELLRLVEEIKIPRGNLLKERELMLTNSRRIFEEYKRDLDYPEKFKQIYLKILFSKDETEIKEAIKEMREFFQTYIPEFDFMIERS